MLVMVAVEIIYKKIRRDYRFFSFQSNNRLQDFYSFEYEFDDENVQIPTYVIIIIRSLFSHFILSILLNAFSYKIIITVENTWM